LGLLLCFCLPRETDDVCLQPSPSPEKRKTRFPKEPEDDAITKANSSRNREQTHTGTDPVPWRNATPHAPAANRPPAGQARNAAAERERPPACRGTVGRADPPLGITRAARTRKPTGTRLIQAEPEPSRAAPALHHVSGSPPSRHRQATTTPHLRVDDDPFARSFLPSFLARSSAAKRNPLPPPPSHHHSRTAATVPRLTEAT